MEKCVSEIKGGKLLSVPEKLGLGTENQTGNPYFEVQVPELR